MAEPVSADVLKALSHPVRLAMLVALEQQELTVPELAKRIGVPARAGAPHLEALRGAGLVQDGGQPGHVRTSAKGWAAIERQLRRMQAGD